MLAESFLKVAFKYCRNIAIFAVGTDDLIFGNELPVLVYHALNKTDLRRVEGAFLLELANLLGGQFV